MPSLTRLLRKAAADRGWPAIARNHSAAGNGDLWLIWPRNGRRWARITGDVSDGVSVRVELAPDESHEAAVARLIEKAERVCAANGFDPVAGDFKPSPVRERVRAEG